MIKIAVAIVVTLITTTTGLLGQAGFNICEKGDLVRALAYVYYGCGTVCESSVLKQLDGGAIDRQTLLGILSSPRVTVRHIFFPMGMSDMESALDWDIKGEGSKQDQLRSLKTAVDEGGMLFILGKASTVGDPFRNQELSQLRMGSVRAYLDRVGVDCPVVKGGWFGEEAFQFDESDAARLIIRPYEYRAPGDSDFERLTRRAYSEAKRNALFTLNQAVHVLFVPCKPEALVHPHRSLIWHHYRQSVSGPLYERATNERITRALFSSDSNATKTVFIDELCSFCLGGGNRPLDAPLDVTGAEACALAQALRADGRACRSPSIN